MPEQISGLRAAVNDEVPDRITYQARSIQGLSAEIGAHRLQRLAEKLEMAALQGQPAAARVLAMYLEKEFLHLKNVLACPEF
jgi:HPt (histidine-containing phosphotransfer) domain-containing protein